MSLSLHSTNQLLQSLPTAEFERLCPHLEFVELVRETVLVQAGAPVTHIYLPQSAVLAMMVRLPEGLSVEIALIGRDSVFGAAAALDDAISLTDAIVRLPGTTSVLDVEYVWAAADRSGSLRALPARHEQSLTAEAQQSAACNAAHSDEARLSRWLLRTRDLTGSENLPLTQECLAQMLGVQRNAVSLVANSLQRAGVIRYSRGHIEIREVAGLSETSCECYRTVKTQHDRLLKHRPAPAITDS
jgi:CRP-like cAMP-binding protein